MRPRRPPQSATRASPDTEQNGSRLLRLALGIAIYEHSCENFLNMGNHTSEASAPLAGCNLIVLEDHTDTRQMITFVLEQNGALVRASGAVLPALEMFREQRPDVVVADISMAGLNGYAFISEVRRIESEGGLHTPVIAMTAFASPQDRDLAMSAGFDGYIVKPFNLNELISAIMQLCSERQRKSP